MKDLPKEVIEFINFAGENCDVPCELYTIKKWSEDLLKKY